MSVCVAGSLNVDWVLEVASLPRAGETLLAGALSRHVGGKGANQAVAAARAGSATRLIGRVGDDEAGAWLLDFLRSQHIDVTAVSRDPEASTGQAFITMSHGGENTIVVAAGANARPPLPTEPGAVLAGEQGLRDQVLLAQLETSMPSLAALFAVPSPGCIKILNAAPAVPAGRDLFPHADIVVVNETELASYARLPVVPDDTEAVVSAARSLLVRDGQHLVVTRGAQGAVIVGWDRVHAMAGRAVNVVDTVGAGDCFCGVLAAGLDQGLALEIACEQANLAAGIAVGRRGAAQAMPTAAEIRASMNGRPQALSPNRTMPAS